MEDLGAIPWRKPEALFAFRLRQPAVGGVREQGFNLLHPGAGQPVARIEVKMDMLKKCFVAANAVGSSVGQRFGGVAENQAVSADPLCFRLDRRIDSPIRAERNCMSSAGGRGRSGKEAKGGQSRKFTPTVFSNTVAPELIPR